MWLCPRCRTSNKDSTNFCKRCGEYVADDAKEPDQSSPQQTPAATAKPTPTPPSAPQNRKQPTQPAQRPSRPQPEWQPQPPTQPAQPVQPAPAARSSPAGEIAAEPQYETTTPKPTPPPKTPTPAASKRPLIDKRLLRAAERQAERLGNNGEPDEHIDWSSASTVAGAMKSQIASGRKQTGQAVPSDLRDELFGDQPAAKPVDDLPIHTRPADLLTTIEASISKRALMAVAAITLAAFVISVIGNNSIVNSFEQGTTPDLPIPALGIAPLAGVWLGVDRSNSADGVPVTYLFTRPNWLIVTEPGANPAGAPAVVAQANYTYRSGNLSMQPLAGSNNELVPSAATASISDNAVKITPPAGNGEAPIVLTRTAALNGTWQAVGGAGKYKFDGTAADGSLTVTAPGGKPINSYYTVAGNILRVAKTNSPVSAADGQAWQYTFDGAALLLYMPDPNNPTDAPNYAAPLRLTRTR